MRHDQTMRSLRLVVLAVCTALVGCGSTSSSTSTGSSRNVVRTRTQPTAGPPPAVSELGAAEHPASSDFPAPAGRTLRQLARLASASAQLGAATGTFVPGEQRLAF